MARERMCIACRERASDDALIRLVAAPDGVLVVDLRGRLPGRGAWIHPSRECIQTVQKRPQAVHRALKTRVDVSELLESVISRVEAAALDGLSLAAASGALVSGHDALARALSAREVAVVAVANDASERTVSGLKQASDDDVQFVSIGLVRNELGARIGAGPRAAVGVTSSRASAHLRQQLRRLRQLR